MHVKAAPGHRVPTENDPYTYIEDAEAVDVPDTSTTGAVWRRKSCWP